MISIGKLRSAEAAVEYLQHAIADNAIEYYVSPHKIRTQQPRFPGDPEFSSNDAHPGESPGHWYGPGAQRLGLSREVAPDQLRAVLNGFDPRTGKQLGRRWDSQTVTAFDVTFSAPKSVSLLYALGDDETRRIVLEAHDAGVEAALDYMQKHAGWARKYNRVTNTVELVKAELIMPRFRHRTARPVTDPETGVTTIDPQLHTHVPIPTWVCRPDGSWSALMSEPLYMHAASAGAVGQAAMRKMLIDRLGVEVEVSPNGTFEIVGITEAQRREFSKRRQLIEVAEATFGVASIKGRETANLATREAKEEPGVGPQLFDAWRSRAIDVGLEPTAVAQLMHRRHPARQFQISSGLVSELVGVRGLTAQAATFSRRDVVRTVAAMATDGLTPREIEAVVDAILLDRRHVVPLGRKVADIAARPDDSQLVPRSGQTSAQISAIGEGTNDWDGRANLQHAAPTQLRVPARSMSSDNPNTESTRPPMAHAGGTNRALHSHPDRDQSARTPYVEIRYSTPEMVALERRMFDLAVARQTTDVAVVGHTIVDTTIFKRPTLTREQRTMVETILTRGDGAIVVEGVAGAGKTFALEACREAFDAAGHHVVGLALAGRAAETLEHESAIRSHTIASAIPVLLEESLPAQSVVIVDEAGMIGDRQMAQLVEIAARDNAKLVLCGDSRQLQPIDAGSPFRVLGDKLGRIELTESVRQRDVWERAALSMVRSGEIAPAVDEFLSHGRITTSRTASDRRRQVVLDALDERSRGNDTIVLTRDRDEATAINELTRAVLKARGRLSDGGITVEGRDFAIGDRVICTRPDRRLGLTNGLMGTVDRIDDEALMLKTSRGMVEVPFRRYQHVDHAYALTAHKAQGITVDVALVVGSEAASQEWAYSVMSRARKQTRYFVVENPITRDRDGIRHEPEVAPELERRLVQSWSWSEAKDSALDYEIKR